MALTIIGAQNLLQEEVNASPKTFGRDLQRAAGGGTLYITENGTYDVSRYSQANVDVSDTENKMIANAQQVSDPEREGATLTLSGSVSLEDVIAKCVNITVTCDGTDYVSNVQRYDKLYCYFDDAPIDSLWITEDEIVCFLSDENSHEVAVEGEFLTGFAPQGEVNITTNNVWDVFHYATAKVSVEPTFFRIAVRNQTSSALVIEGSLTAQIESADKPQIKAEDVTIPAGGSGYIYVPITGERTISVRTSTEYAYSSGFIKYFCTGRTFLYIPSQPAILTISEMS